MRGLAAGTSIAVVFRAFGPARLAEAPTVGYLAYGIAKQTFFRRERTKKPLFFLDVSSDYYEPLRMWSAILQRQAWASALPPSDAFEANWCGSAWRPAR